MAGPVGSLPNFGALATATATQVLGVYDLSNNGGNCTPSTTYGRSCVLTVQIPQSLTSAAGAPSADFDIETYQAPVATIAALAATAQDAPDLLSAGLIPSAIVNKNVAGSLNVVLGARPASYAPITVTATNHTQQSVVQSTTVVAYDASGNTIVGPYLAPETVTVTSATPDLTLSVNGSSVGSGGTVYGSGDALAVVYDGKGMLTGSVSLFGISSTVTVANITAIDEYNGYSSSDGGLPSPFNNFQPVAIALDPNGVMYVLSSSGPNGQPTIVQFAMTPAGVTTQYCQFTQSPNNQGPDTFSSQMVVDNSYVYVFDSQSNGATLYQLGFQNGGSCNQNQSFIGLTTSVPVTGATLTSDGSVWLINQNGGLFQWNSAQQIDVATQQYGIATGTTGSRLYAYGTSGLLWVDPSASTLNAFLFGTGLAREASGASVMSGNYATSGGASLFSLTGGALALESRYGDIATFSAVSPLVDWYGSTGTAQPNFMTTTQLFGGPNFPMANFVAGAEGGTAIYGIFGASSQSGGSPGLARYGKGLYGFTGIPNEPLPFVPAGAVLGQDGRIWFVSSSGSQTALYAFPGSPANGQTIRNSVRTISKGRTPAKK